MRVPLEVSYRDVERTEALDNMIREHVERLHRFARDIVACRVAVENRQPGTTGNPFRVRIELTMPPKKLLIAKRRPGEDDTHLTLESVVQNTFKAMERQLKKVVEQRRGEVKVRQQPSAVVVRLFPEQGYGFIVTPNGREIYFHRNAVLNGDFDRIEIGSEVRYVQEMGDEGPQASTVQLVNRRGVSDSAVEIDQARIIPDQRQADLVRALRNGRIPPA